MYDFYKIHVKETKNSVTIEPKFIVCRSSDLMIRGGDFYAIWLEKEGLWSTDEHDVVRVIDESLSEYRNTHEFDKPVVINYMWDADSHVIDKWHKYCQKQARDNFHMLDRNLTFSNTEVNKKDYASKRLPYPLVEGPCPAWERLISTLYLPEERHKIEWAIGSIVAGDSKKIQKFVVLYGEPGAGKGTILNVILKLFDGYSSTFEAKTLGSSTNAFALEQFKNNPLVAVQQDGDLYGITDNTRINSLVSHEKMTVNEKFKSTYSASFDTFLFLGTNKPVKITDAKSGLLRRLIDVSPSGIRIPPEEYDEVVYQVDFELGAIAYHCMQVYLADKKAYHNYVPQNMLSETNDFYNFIEDSFFIFKSDDGVALKAAWEMYKSYCEDAKVSYVHPLRSFKTELKDYFEEVLERYTLSDGTRVRNYYKGFISSKFVNEASSEEKSSESWIELKDQPSILDDFLKEYPAQYARFDEEGNAIPSYKWANVKTFLKDLNTHKDHYTKCPLNLIVIDFDIKDSFGKKSREGNLLEASKWPKTYCELSKSGSGVHLHYFYKGDVSKLSRVYSDDIEVKIFNGDSSLRRKLTLCNDIPIAEITSGLPFREKKVINVKVLKNEKHIRALIKKALYKEIEPGSTVCCIDFIDHILQEAYDSGMEYDVGDMYQDVLIFAGSSTHHANSCMAKVSKMKFKSEKNVWTDDLGVKHDDKGRITFFDVEVYPNFTCVCWEYLDDDEVYSVKFPKPNHIAYLVEQKLIGFNNRRYDNHILYGWLQGDTVEQSYIRSDRIINRDSHNDPFFREAWNLSYADIYDFSSEKQSLKKFEIDLGIHHQEMDIPWDQPVPEDMFDKVVEYCKNDVRATKALFLSASRQADWTARQILADISGMQPNETTNRLSTRFIFEGDKHPQSQFNYRNMGDISEIVNGIKPYENLYTKFNVKGLPIFPGYYYGLHYRQGDSLVRKKEHEEYLSDIKWILASVYRGEEVGEGGYVYAEPGIYHNVTLLDIASMHPSSICAETLFGDKYTKRFKDILDARLAIKHKDFDKARKMMDGKLAPYLKDESSAKSLSSALKIVINSVYGLTSARFDNPFKDPRNKDNIVAKRGALFMVNLKYEVQKRGFTVAHIKTDSIKIPDATPEIIQFVMDYGKQYGYNFEHEATYEKMCLVNDSVYIAKYSKDSYNEHPGEWTATGKEFAVPTVFKRLFSREPIEFDDMCVTNQVQTSMYLDFGTEDKPQRRFVGKVGSFVPILPGHGGGRLLREGKDKNGNPKYDSVNGSKGYTWLEAETVKGTEYEQWIDQSYFQSRIDDVVDHISEFGDVEQFLD